ncbi:unnamed protein product [Cunninghamella blakesleeana]
MSFCTYRFTSSSFNSLPDHCYQLNLRQQPQRAKISLINERDRRTIEPPPIIQLQWNDCSPDETKKRLQCPFYFMVVTLLSADTNELLSTQDYLSGSTVSSLYRLRDINDEDGGFFIFGDLYCKKQGHYKLKFSLFEIIGENVQTKQTIISDAFKTYIPKNYPGPVEATILSRTFSDQGIKLRIRKEHRSQSIGPRKRKFDVQLLMENQSIHKNLKTIVSSNSTTNTSNPSFNRFQVTKQEPIKIAPAITNHSQYNTTTLNVMHTNNRNHVNDDEVHQQQQKYTSIINQHHSSLSSSPSLSPSTSFKDELSLSSLDEYSLQSSSTSTTSSCSSSSYSTIAYPLPPISSSSSSTVHHRYSSPPLKYDYDHWGHSLPLLKDIMNGYTSNSTLLLPCPFNHS